MPYIWFLLICLMWGSSFILMKKAAFALSPVEIATMRVFSGAVALGVLCWWNRTLSWPRRGDWGWLVFLMIVGYVWPYSLQPHLVSKYGSGLIGMTVSFVPLLTIIVSIPVLGVYPSVRQVIGVLGALGCLAILVWDSLRRDIPAFDLCLAGTVPLGYSLCNTFIRRSLGHLHSLPLSFLSLAGAAMILMPLSATGLGPQVEARQSWALSLSSAIVLGVLSTGVAIWLFNKLIQEEGPLFAGMVTNLVPVGAVLWGWADNEQVTAAQMIALIGIVVMVTIVQLGSATGIARRELPAVDLQPLRTQDGP